MVVVVVVVVVVVGGDVMKSDTWLVLHAICKYRALTSC